VPLGSAFPINDFTMGDQGAAGVWVEPSGGFVVAFDSPRGYQVDFGNALSAAIDARRFDAAGMPLGTEFKVNMESATVDAGVPRLAAGPSGEFMVVWDDAAPGSNFDLDDIGARFFGFVAPVGGTKLLLRDDQDNPAKRRLVFRATDQVLSTNPGAGVNPLQDGAYLHVYNTAGTGDSACIALSAANWVQKGQTGALVYRYADPSYALGPCKKVSVKQGKIIKASCKALLQPIPYSLDEIEQGSVAVRFVSGDAAYCAHFEGAAVTTDGSRRFVARFAPAPAACPAPVGACP
jgi:hypothetical protein